MEGTLSVMLVCGENMAVRDKNGKSDPHVKFRLGSQKFNSTVKYRTLNPVWNEKFEFILSSRNETLLVKVRDKDTFGNDDSLGWCFVKIDSLVPFQETDLTLALQEVESGQLRLRVTYKPLYDLNAKERRDGSIQPTGSASSGTQSAGAGLGSSQNSGGGSAASAAGAGSAANQLPMPDRLKMLQGEEITALAVCVDMLITSTPFPAFMLLTNYRVIFYDNIGYHEEVPLGTIRNVLLEGLKITLTCKDIRDISVKMADGSSHARLIGSGAGAASGAASGASSSNNNSSNSSNLLSPASAAGPGGATARISGDPPASPGLASSSGSLGSRGIRVQSQLGPDNNNNNNTGNSNNSSSGSGDGLAASGHGQRGTSEWVVVQPVSTPAELQARSQRTYHTLLRSVFSKGKVFAHSHKLNESSGDGSNLASSTGSNSNGSSNTPAGLNFGVRFLAATSAGAKWMNGWSVYNPTEEFVRMGITAASGWRITDLNQRYDFSPTYPKLLCVPASISDKDLVVVSRFRSKGRIPVLCWKSRSSAAAIMRCSQPLVGLRRTRCKEDEGLLAAARALTISGGSTALSSAALASIAAADGQKQVYIVDARPRANAVGNTAMGKGWEDTSNYENSQVLFMNIQNIHVVRRSLAKLQLSIMRADDAGDLGWYEQLTASGWLLHIKSILHAAHVVAGCISVEECSVIVHCSDGWDRTSQITALSELMLDSYYRTIEGFMCLIEKEWISFGHKFSDRCGHGGLCPEQETSPIFLQFIDCVWQITRQFPEAFEFDDRLLLTIMDHLYSCRFGTFLFNCDRERQAASLSKKTESLWTMILMDRQSFTNPLFEQSSNVLVPVCELRTLEIWKAYYFRYAPHLSPQVLSGRLGRHQLIDSLRQSKQNVLNSFVRSRFSEAAPEDLEASETDGETSDEVDEGQLKTTRSYSSASENSMDDASGFDDPAKFEEAKARRPEWMKNSKTRECIGCCKKFSFFKRRHHCRWCGLIYCASCCSNRLAIPELGYMNPVRVCNECFVNVWQLKVNKDQAAAASASQAPLSSEPSSKDIVIPTSP